MNSSKIKRKFPHEKSSELGTFTRLHKKRAFYKVIITFRLRKVLSMSRVFCFVNGSYSCRLLPKSSFLPSYHATAHNMHSNSRHFSKSSALKCYATAQ